MKKLLTITTLLILTTSYIQSADWISDNLRADLRVNPMYRDLVKIIQERTGTATPIIFVKTDMKNDIRAFVGNFGIGSFRFAVMGINQARFKYAEYDQAIRVLAHETVHIDRNHGGITGALALTGASMMMLSPILKLAQSLSSVPLRAGKTLGIGLSLAATGILYPQDRTENEHEADRVAFEKLNQLGLCDTLENLSQQYQSMHESHEDFNKQFQIDDPSPSRDGPEYPTFKEMHEWAAEMAIECRQNKRDNH